MDAIIVSKTTTATRISPPVDTLYGLSLLSGEPTPAPGFAVTSGSRVVVSFRTSFESKSTIQTDATDSTVPTLRGPNEASPFPVFCTPKAEVKEEGS